MGCGEDIENEQRHEAEMGVHTRWVIDLFICTN